MVRYIEDLILDGPSCGGNGLVDIGDVAFIGERKGNISVFTATRPPSLSLLHGMTDYLSRLGSNQPDPWEASVNEPRMLINADEDLVLAYLKVISNLWGISCSTIG